MAARKTTGSGSKTGSKTPATKAKTTKAVTPKATTAKTATTPRTAGRQIELTEIPPSITVQIWKLLRTTVFGRILLAGIVFAVMVLLNLLFSGNRFERFALLLGIEVILIAIIAWIVYLYRNRDDFFNQSEN